MLRDFILFIFALAAVPLATFIYEIFKGLLSRSWSSVMQGIIDSWEGALAAGIAVGITLIILHRIDIRKEARDDKDRIALTKSIQDLVDEIKKDRDERNNKPKP